MAFADPQILVLNGSNVELPRTSSERDASRYTSGDASTKLVVSHRYGRRNRHVVRVDHKKITNDPLQANVSFLASMSAYLVIDTPPSGYSVAEAKAIVDALSGFLVASSGQKVAQVLGGES